MRGVELIIKGRKVTDIGYRPFLLLNALRCNIPRFFASNAKANGDGQEMVLVRIQGDDDQIAQYINFVRSKYPEHAQVGEIVERSFEGQVMDAASFLQFLQFEQITKAVPALVSIDKKQSIMIEKQDATIGILKDVKGDTSAIKDDISSLKKDASESLYEKYERLCREIAEIKATLSEIKAKAA
jgi:acylphosphatase